MLIPQRTFRDVQNELTRPDDIGRTFEMIVDDLSRTGRMPTTFAGLCEALASTFVTQDRLTGRLEAKLYIPAVLARGPVSDRPRDVAGRILEGLAPSHVRLLFDGAPSQGEGVIVGNERGQFYGLLLATGSCLRGADGYIVDANAPSLRVLLATPETLGASRWRLETLPPAVADRLVDLFTCLEPEPDEYTVVRKENAPDAEGAEGE